MNVAVDLDNCVGDFNQMFCHFARIVLGREFPKTLTREENTEYSYHHLIPDRQELSDVWDRIYAEKDLWITNPPLLDAMDWMEFRTLKNNKHINMYFITKRVQVPGDSVLHQTREWLQMLGWSNPQVIVTKKKAEVIKALDIEFMCDDAPNNLLKIKDGAPDCNLFAFDWAYNRHIDVPRVNNLKEYRDEILKAFKPTPLGAGK